MKVADIMTREVVTVPPGASLKHAANLLIEHRISGLPVVDDHGHVLGVVSEADILTKEAAGMDVPGPLAWLAGFDVEVDRSKLDARFVGEAMTSPPVTIAAHCSVSLAARRMSEKGINRLPVVAEGGELVGIVTRADLVRAFVRSDAEIATEIREDVILQRARLDKHSVRVEVEDGEVTLSGTIGRDHDARALEALVREIPGVVGVHSELV